MWHGVVVAVHRPDTGAATSGVAIPAGRGWEAELSWYGAAPDMALLEPLLPTGDHLQRIEHEDLASGIYRAAVFRDDLLICALLVDRNPLVVDRRWLVLRLGTPLDPAERFRLLDGRPGGFARPRGEIVCFCRDVGREEVIDAVAAGARTVAEIGLATMAGTSCGGCRPSLARIAATSASRQLRT